jgi:DNA-binding response OmpR family regulator
LKAVIIEDDRAIAECTGLILKRNWPYIEINSAASGEEGVTLVRSQSPDIVILDIGLPDISGFKVLEKVRSFFSGSVLISTARDSIDDKTRAIELGANGYITKPFKNADFSEKVAELVGKEANYAAS